MKPTVLIHPCICEQVLLVMTNHPTRFHNQLYIILKRTEPIILPWATPSSTLFGKKDAEIQDCKLDSYTTLVLTKGEIGIGALRPCMQLHYENPNDHAGQETKIYWNEKPEGNTKGYRVRFRCIVDYKEFNST